MRGRGGGGKEGRTPAGLPSLMSEELFWKAEKKKERRKRTGTLNAAGRNEERAGDLWRRFARKEKGGKGRCFTQEKWDTTATLVSKIQGKKGGKESGGETPLYWVPCHGEGKGRVERCIPCEWRGFWRKEGKGKEKVLLHGDAFLGKRVIGVFVGGQTRRERGGGGGGGGGRKGEPEF